MRLDSRAEVISVGHIAENCSSEQRLCYNCRQPGHESAACPSPRSVAAKQCYSCGGVGHIQGMDSLSFAFRRSIVSSRMSQLEGAEWKPKMLCLCSVNEPGPRVDLFPELWSLRSLCPQLSGPCSRWRRLCFSRASAWPRSEHVDVAAGQMLSLRRSQPYG